MKGTLAVVMMAIIIRAGMKCRGDVQGPRSPIKTGLESQVKDGSLILKLCEQLKNLKKRRDLVSSAFRKVTLAPGRIVRQL